VKAILDTGPWVALIDRSENRHKTCVQWLKNFSGRLYSTEAVLTEVLYLLNFSINAQMAALDFVIESVAEIIPLNLESTKKCKKLMQKYSDLPMDYADATIVCLANEIGIKEIVTFDKKDFNIYKFADKKNFYIFP
jgi:predicted nucleic acid-binding protein